MISKVNKVKFFVLLVCSLTGLSLGGEDGIENRMSNHIALTPFYIYGDSHWNYAVGLEANRWYKPLEGGYHLFGYGYGARLYYSQDNDYENHDFVDKHSIYFSPMGSMYYLWGSFFFIVGASVSPEVGFGSDGFDYGFSARAWYLAFGAEFRWTKKRDRAVGFYIYLPFYGWKL